VARLTAYGWPGNVRELENAVERMVVMARGAVIEPADLPPELLAGRGGAVGQSGELDAAVAATARAYFGEPPPQGVYRAILDQVEGALVREALERTGNVRLKAAQLLGINRNTLQAKLEGQSSDRSGGSDRSV
jgi:DNA-binding NtrC family response regulator